MIVILYNNLYIFVLVCTQSIFYQQEIIQVLLIDVNQTVTVDYYCKLLHVQNSSNT